MAEMQNIAVESESGEEEEEEEKDGGKVDRDGEVESDTEKLRRSALDKLENASENSFLGQASSIRVRFFLSFSLFFFVSMIERCKKDREFAAFDVIEV